MLFVETPIFTERIRALMDDNDYQALQAALILRPESGVVVPGSGGLRKLRWGAQGRGKRGGLRIIYFWYPVRSTCYMLFPYAKNEQGDLTAAQTRALGRLVREEFS